MGFPRAVHVEVPLFIIVSKSRGALWYQFWSQRAFSLTVLATGGPNPLVRKGHQLKFEPGGNLEALQPELIEEIVGTLVPELIVKGPVPDLGIDVTSDVATYRAVTLPGNIGSDSKSADVGLGGQIERLTQIQPTS